MTSFVPRILSKVVTTARVHDAAKSKWRFVACRNSRGGYCNNIVTAPAVSRLRAGFASVPSFQRQVLLMRKTLCARTMTRLRDVWRQHRLRIPTISSTSTNWLRIGHSEDSSSHLPSQGRLTRYRSSSKQGSSSELEDNVRPHTRDDHCSSQWSPRAKV